MSLPALRIAILLAFSLGAAREGVAIECAPGFGAGASTFNVAHAYFDGLCGTLENRRDWDFGVLVGAEAGVGGGGVRGAVALYKDSSHLLTLPGRAFLASARFLRPWGWTRWKDDWFFGGDVAYQEGILRVGLGVARGLKTGDMKLLLALDVGLL